jgi:DNA-binding NarL/FixJ family response regulator
MIRILIVEDHTLVREAVAQTLTHLQAGTECVEARNAEAALALLADGSEWDLAVIDLMLPDMNGFSLLAVLAKRFPDVPALVVSALDDAASVQRALKGGASGFVPKASSGAEMLAAVRMVLDGGVYTPATAGEAAGSGNGSGPGGSAVSERYHLTAAQTRVLELLAQGKTNREIADLLGLAEGTVKVHMSAIFRAMNVANRSQALVAIARHGVRP